jgi:hypothetical protein
MTINKVIDDFSFLTLEDKEYVLDIIKKQLVESKRESIANRAKEATSAFKKDLTKKGSYKDLYKDLECD